MGMRTKGVLPDKTRRNNRAGKAFKEDDDIFAQLAQLEGELATEGEGTGFELKREVSTVETFEDLYGSASLVVIDPRKGNQQQNNPRSRQGSLVTRVGFESIPTAIRLSGTSDGQYPNSKSMSVDKKHG